MVARNTSAIGAGQPAIARSGALPAAPPAAAAEPRPQATTDSLRIEAVAADPGLARTIEAQAHFDTGSAKLGSGRPALDRTLDAVIATFKTMPPEKQRALLADPNFRIEIEGRASNLGSDRKFDNVGLSRRRAEETAQYVKAYLQRGGLDVPDSAVKASGAGTPGRSKAADNNDQADRAASIRFTMPGLPPLPAIQAEPRPPRPARPPADPAPVDPAPAEPAPADIPPAPPAAEEPPPATEPSPADAALTRFNAATEPVNGMLAKGGADDSSLADREALVSKVKDALKAAEAELPNLAPVAQPGARALVNGLGDQLQRLSERAKRERGSLLQLQAQFKTEEEELEKAAAAKDKRGLRTVSTRLLEKYKAADAVGKDLPADARGELAKQAAGLRRKVYEAIARHSDDHKLDQVDNSYMFGRPGPKFKKAWDTLKEILQSSGPPTSEQRSKAVVALKDMDDAVDNFDDPLVKEAAKAIYDDLTRTVSAKLAGPPI